MKRTTIDLDQDQDQRLTQLAHASGRSLGALVRDALRQYLTKHPVNGAVGNGVPRVVKPSELIPEDEAAWQRRVGAVLARVRANTADDVTPEAIEQDIPSASEEAREKYRTPGQSSEPPKITSDDREGRQREFRVLLDHVHSRVSADMTSEEIEREITLASEEVRRERLRHAPDRRG